MNCIVKGCQNKKGEGTFIGDLCQPCYTMITTGVIGYGATFLHDLKKDAVQMLDDAEKSIQAALEKKKRKVQDMENHVIDTMISVHELRVIVAPETVKYHEEELFGGNDAQ